MIGDATRVVVVVVCVVIVNVAARHGGGNRKADDPSKKDMFLSLFLCFLFVFLRCELMIDGGEKDRYIKICSPVKKQLLSGNWVVGGINAADVQAVRCRTANPNQSR